MGGRAGASLGDDALALHRRLLEDDPTAPADLAEAFLDRLAAWLVDHNRTIDPHLCETAAADAILALIRRPASYQPQRQSLEYYLRLSASGDLKNLLRRERRQRGPTTRLEVVELSPDGGKHLRRDDDDPARIAELRETVAAGLAARPRPPGLSAREERVLRLMQERERRTRVYAAALGIEHLPVEAQRRAVKQVKDRLTKRLERARPTGG